MRPNIYVRSRLAIAVAAICMLSLLTNLFWHVRSLEDLTPYHLSALVVVVLSGAFELLMWRAKAERDWLQAPAWCVLWLASIAVVAGISCGRNAEILVNRKTAVLQADGARLNHEREIAEARIDREAFKTAADKAQAAADAKSAVATSECRTARKWRCEGATTLAGHAAAESSAALKRYQGADARYWQLVAQLDHFKPLPPANMELKNMARLWILFTGNDVESLLELLWPFLITLITEMGFCRGLSYGLHYKTVPDLRVVDEPRPMERSFKNLSVSEKPLRRYAKNRLHNPLAMNRADAQVDLITFIQINGHVPSQEFLRERWQVRSKGTVSVWLRDWETNGLIRRQQDGRVKITKAATRA